MLYKYFGKIRKLLFFIFLLVLAITFFTKNNYRTVEEIDPNVLEEPIQTETENKKIIKFVKDDYKYELTPLYDYELNGLLVHKFNYSWLGFYKRDSVFPIDLCVIWGDNIKSKVYQNKSLNFSQDMRFCRSYWQGKIDFDSNHFSNNHLIIKSDEFKKKIKELSVGDQIKIRGKLVNVSAKNIGKVGKYDPEFFQINSSISRTDAEAGACEVIYLEDIQILKKGNLLSHNLYKISFYGLIVLIVWGLINFFKIIFITEKI